jgi:hypothetical protein
MARNLAKGRMSSWTVLPSDSLLVVERFAYFRCAYAFARRWLAVTWRALSFGALVEVRIRLLGCHR